MDKDECVGCIVCKLEPHKEMYRGYIAMLAVKKEYRGRRLGAFGGRIVAAFFLEKSNHKLWNAADDASMVFIGYAPGVCPATVTAGAVVTITSFSRDGIGGCGDTSDATGLLRRGMWRGLFTTHWIALFMRRTDNALSFSREASVAGKRKLQLICPRIDRSEWPAGGARGGGDQ
jgi:hypothetical protein